MSWIPLKDVDPGEHTSLGHVKSTLSQAEAFKDLARDTPGFVKDLQAHDLASATIDGTELGAHQAIDSHHAMGINKEDHQYMNDRVLPKAEAAIEKDQGIIDQEQRSINNERQQLQTKNNEIQREWGTLAGDRTLSQEQRDQKTQALHEKQAQVDKETIALDQRQLALDSKQAEVDMVQHNIDSWHTETGYGQTRGRNELDAQLHKDAAYGHQAEANQDIQSAEHHSQLREQHAQQIQQHQEMSQGY